MLARAILAFACLLIIVDLQFVFKFERASPIEKGAFLAAALAFVLTRPISRTIVLLWAACTVMIVMLGALTTYAMFDWGTLLMALNQIMILYALLAIKPSRKDRDFLLLAGALIPVGSVALGTVYSSLGLWPLFQSEFATGLPRMAGSVIPAYLSAFGMCGAFAAVLLATLNNKPGYLVLAAIDLIILLLAGGRATLAVALPICALAFLISDTTPLKAKLAGMIAAPIALAAVMVTVGKTALERLMMSTDNGREILWNFTLGLGERHPWTGIGFGHAYWATPRKIKIMTGTQATHNDYVRLIAELGYIGMPLFYFFLVLAVARAWLRGRRTILPWAALLGYLFLSRSDNVLTTPSLFLLIVLGVVADAHVGDAEQRQPGARLWRRFPAIRGASRDRAALNA